MGFSRQRCFEALVAAAKTRSALLYSSTESSTEGSPSRYPAASIVAASLREDIGAALFDLARTSAVFTTVRIVFCTSRLRGPSAENFGWIFFFELRIAFADGSTSAT